MLNNKMEETFTHIHNYWKEEEYKKFDELGETFIARAHPSDPQYV